MPPVATDCRLIDHLLVALQMWAAPVACTAVHLEVFFKAIAESSFDQAAQAIEAAMSSLVQLALLANQACRAAQTFESRVLCYRLTFVLWDVYALVAEPVMPSLAAKDRRLHGCKCQVCATIGRVRLEYHYVGPAPRNLHSALDALRSGDPAQGQATLTMLCQLVRKINATWGC